MMKLFPIMMPWEGRKAAESAREIGAMFVVIAIPWDMIAPHDKQAQANHGGQTIQRLYERGGLDATEALAVLEDKPFPWRTHNWAKSNAELARLVAAWGQS